MLADPLQSLDPLRLAKFGKRIEGNIQLDSLDRLVNILLEKKRTLHYSLIFGIDDSKTCYIESDIKTVLIMECQRCLEPVTIYINKQTDIGIVKDKLEIKKLAAKYEPLLINAGVIKLKDLIEDELLLAIPFSPLHSTEQCRGSIELRQTKIANRVNPFANLTFLKKDKN